MTTISAPPAAATDNSPYVLGRTIAEHDRLVLQAAKLEPFTAALLDRVGVPHSAHCLDVGCGTGAVMGLMARRAGPDGHVVGVDIDAVLGERAMATLRRAGHRQCRFVAGDVLELSEPEEGPFDIVFARLVLIHADDPLALLRRMWEWTAPGGTLVVQDYDLRAIACEPPTALFDEFRRVVFGVFARAGRPLDAGLRLPRWFVEAGVGEPEGTMASGIVESMAEIRPIAEGVYRSTLPLALEFGLVSAAESEAWLDALAAAPPNHTACHPLLVGAYARKPN
jgi:ubiquinone/menaquinone biosynthesis C-methylase UbiE